MIIHKKSLRMKKIMTPLIISGYVLFCGIILTDCNRSQIKATPEEARTIAKEAYIYAFPMIDNYRIFYAYFIDREDPEFKAPLNHIKNIPKVFTPEDKAVQTPNSDTPYSMLGLDLRAEPIVLTVPAVEKERYCSVQLIDFYTFNFNYISPRTTGHDGGSFLVAGPKWKGEVPVGIKKVFRSETEFGMAAYRTQLFNADDIGNVKKIQEGYKVQKLSEFLGQAAPAPVPELTFNRPLDKEQEKTSLAFIDELNFILQFCPTDSSEREMMDRFARIGIGAGKKFDTAALSPELKKAIKEGIQDAWNEYKEFENTEIITGKVSSGDLFGTRAYLKNNYLYRMSAAIIGIYGNSKEEAVYPLYRIDADGNPLDASKNKYFMHFAPGQFPPVNAFWSVTMYDLPGSLLVANPINRYLINSPMLPNLKLDKDGGLTIYIQNTSPGKEKEANWLPAPDGPFWIALRLYYPKEEALTSAWKQPLLERVK